MSFLKNSTAASGTPFSWAKHGDKNKKSWNQNVATYIYTATTKHIRIIAGDFNAQLGLGTDSERDFVGEHTTGQSNKRGIRMKQWWMIQNHVALNTTFTKKKKNRKHTFRSPSGKEKQLDCVVIVRRNRRYCTDAEANDMIHLGTDHRSVTAHFRFPCKKEGLENKKTETESLQRYKIREISCINGAT